VLSGDIIPLLFGAKWASSAAIAQVLSLMAVPFCINYFLVSALAAIGRPGSIAKSTGVQTVAALGLSLLAAPFGVQWVAAAYVLRAYLMLPYHLHLFRRDTGVGLLPMMRAVIRAVQRSIHLSEKGESGAQQLGQIRELASMPDSGAAKSLNLCLAAKSLAGCHAIVRSVPRGTQRGP
jgi:hypothetical protein